MTNIQEQSKKGGRPPTGRVRKLSKSVTVKFSKSSYEALRLRARKANRKLAEYIRESALNGEVVSGHNTLPRTSSVWQTTSTNLPSCRIREVSTKPMCMWWTC